MDTIDVKNLDYATALEKFQAAYDKFQTPRQVSPARTPATVEIANPESNWAWRKAARNAGFAFFTQRGQNWILFSTEPLGSTYYCLFY